MFRTRLVSSDERQVDTLGLLELTDKVLQDGIVEVLAPQGCVPIGGLHLEDAARYLQDRDVESSTAQIVDGQDLP
eukprot:4360262-Pyramimonas_sp.AAC.1